MELASGSLTVARLVVCIALALPAGWFAGVLIDRVPDRLPLFDPPEGVRLRGKYLVVHILMVGLFVLAALRFPAAPPAMLAGYLLLFGMLLTVSVIDIELFRLPDRIVLPTFVGSLALVIGVSIVEQQSGAIRRALLGLAVYFGFLFLAHLVYPRGMGFGDVKLAAVMGLYVGWLGTDYIQALGLVLWAMLIGFLLGSVIGVVMFAARKRSTPIPFGPFLAVGAIVTILLSQGLVIGGA